MKDFSARFIKCMYWKLNNKKKPLLNCHNCKSYFTGLNRTQSFIFLWLWVGMFTHRIPTGSLLLKFSVVLLICTEVWIHEWMIKWIKVNLWNFQCFSSGTWMWRFQASPSANHPSRGSACYSSWTEMKSDLFSVE